MAGAVAGGSVRRRIGLSVQILAIPGGRELPERDADMLSGTLRGCPHKAIGAVMGHDLAHRSPPMPVGGHVARHRRSHLEGDGSARSSNPSLNATAPFGRANAPRTTRRMTR